MSESTILYPVSNTSREEFLAKKKRQKQFITSMRLFILIFILGGWEIAARCHLIDDFIFSSPTRILKVMVQMAADRSLFYHIGITIGETLISFILVLILGTFISMLLWWCHSAADILEPYLVVLNSLPKTALAPILIVWLGNNMKTIIVCGVTMAIFSTIINLYTAFIHIDSDKLLLIKTLGGTRKDILRYIVLPASISAIVSNLKVNIGLCLVGVRGADDRHAGDGAHEREILDALVAAAVFADADARMGRADFDIEVGIGDGVANLLIGAAGRKHRKRRAVGDESHRGHTGGDVDHVGLGNAAVVEFFRVRLGDLAGLRGVGEVGVEHDDLIVLFDQFDQRFAVSLTGCNFISHVLSPPIPSKPARAARHWAPCRASRPDSP